MIDKQEISMFGNNIVNLIPEGKVFPLLQMHRLIQFIEEKTNRKLEIVYNLGNYRMWLHEMKNDNCTGNYLFYDNLGKDLLQSLFKTAIRVAEQEVEHE
jgi:hypothetical protein